MTTDLLDFYISWFEIRIHLFSLPFPIVPYHAVLTSIQTTTLLYSLSYTFFPIYIDFVLLLNIPFFSAMKGKGKRTGYMQSSELKVQYEFADAQIRQEAGADGRKKRWSSKAKTGCATCR